jgi:aminopeptidase N
MLPLLLTILAVTGAAPQDSAAIRVAPLRYELELRLDMDAERLDGVVRILLANTSDAPVVEVPLLLYRLMDVTDARAGGRPAPFQQRVTVFTDFSKLQVNAVRVTLGTALAPGDTTQVELTYGGHLLGYAETGMAYIRDRIDPAFTIIRDDALAFPLVGYPSSAVNRAASAPSYGYVARITVPESLVVANTGRLTARTTVTGRTTYVFHSVRPSWRMDFAIGDYALIEQGPLRIYHFRSDSAGAAAVARAARRGLDLFERWFGPLRGDPSLTIIEIENGFGSQSAPGTIIQAAAAFRDTTRDRELYHELAHFWNAPDADRPSSRWNEGLSSFLEYLALEELRGQPLIDQRAERLLDWLRSIAPRQPDLARVPPADYGRAQMTDFSYSVGALAFYLLYRVTGPEDFRAIIGGHYRRSSATGATTEEFLRFARATARADVEPLLQDWFRTARWLELVRGGARAEDLVRRYRAAGAR